MHTRHVNHRQRKDDSLEPASVTRQASLLSITKSAFDVWHVFHMPLVYVMFGIVVLHVALALYLGYVPLTY